MYWLAKVDDVGEDHQIRLELFHGSLELLFQVMFLPTFANEAFAALDQTVLRVLMVEGEELYRHPQFLAANDHLFWPAQNTTTLPHDQHPGSG